MITIYNIESIPPVKLDNDLHFAALHGNLNQLQALLDVNPESFFNLIPKNKNNVHRNFLESTVIHSALLFGEANKFDSSLMDNKFECAKFLLQNAQSCKLINLVNANDVSIISLIANWPNKEQGLELANLAFLNGVIVTDNTPLEIAINNFNVELVEFLLSNNVNPNQLGGDYLEKTNFCILIENFAESILNSNPEIELFNDILLLLIRFNADINFTGADGKTLVDLIESYNLKAYLSPDIANELSNLELSTTEEILKRKNIFYAVQPLSSFSFRSESPLFTNVALLTELKRLKRRNNNNDYDCTVLHGIQQFREFLQLTKLRVDSQQHPLQTHFLIKPRDYHRHLANGQLTIDEQGNVTLFWVDSLGHAYRNETVKENARIGQLVLEVFPDATLYTVDKKIQNNPYGCYIFALYISEQLSAVKMKNKDLVKDLFEVWSEFRIENAGFRVIPWEKCPAYTAVPRIIHSATLPKVRIARNLPQDEAVINKKGQSYKEAIEAKLTFYKGREINWTYHHKRLKFGEKLKDALLRYSNDELLEMKIAGATDVLRRINPNLLIDYYLISLEQQEDGLWSLSIPIDFIDFERDKDFKLIEEKVVITNTLDELQRNIKNNLFRLTLNENGEINMNFSLHQYGVLYSSLHLIDLKISCDNSIDEEKLCIIHA